MQRYFFHIHGEHIMDKDPDGVVLSGGSAAMLYAVTMCAEIGCGSGFYRNIAVSIRDENGAVIGLVSAFVAIAALENRNV